MSMKHALSRSQCKVTAKAPVLPPVKAQVSTKSNASAVKSVLLGVAAAPLLQVAQARAEGAIAVNNSTPVDANVVDNTVDTVIEAVKTAAGLVKSGINAVDSGVQILKQGYDVAAPVIEQGVKTITPAVQQGAKLAADTVGPALKAALPAITDAKDALQSQIQTSSTSLGLDPVVGTTNKAIAAAAPVANQFAQFVSSNDPATLAKYGLGAVALFYLAPPLLGVVGGSLRGYAGEISAAQVLASLGDSSCVLVDLRSQKEKENSGVPDVPGSVSNRCLEVEFATTDDKKLRGALRNPGAIEASVTALQIASLKRISTGSKIILLDRYGGAQAVAKELARRGFGKVFIVSGGFDGRGGWVQSKLQIKPAATVMNTPFPVGRSTGTKKALPAPKA